MLENSANITILSNNDTIWSQVTSFQLYCFLQKLGSYRMNLAQTCFFLWVSIYTGLLFPFPLKKKSAISYIFQGSSFSRDPDPTPLGYLFSIYVHIWQLLFVSIFMTLDPMMFWRKISLSERQSKRGKWELSERESDTPIFYLLIHLLKGHNSQGWSRFKLGARSLIEVSNKDIRGPRVPLLSAVY